MAILSKFQDLEAVILDELTIPDGKTKHLAAVLNALKLDQTTCLIGTVERDQHIYLAGRNIRGVKIEAIDQFNAYMVLRQKRLVLTRAALEQLRQHKRNRWPALAAPAV